MNGFAIAYVLSLTNYTFPFRGNSALLRLFLHFQFPFKRNQFQTRFKGNLYAIIYFPDNTLGIVYYNQLMINSTVQKPREHSLSKSTKGGNSHKLYVTNLDKSLTMEEIYEILSSLVQKIAKNSKIEVKKGHKDSYHYAFIETEDSRTANIILNTLNKQEVKGRPLRIEFQKSRPRQRRPIYQKDHENKLQKKRGESQNHEDRSKRPKYLSKAEERQKDRVRYKEARIKSATQDEKQRKKKQADDFKDTKNHGPKYRDTDYRRRKIRQHSNDGSFSESQPKDYRRSRPHARHPERKQSKSNKEMHSKRYRQESYFSESSSVTPPKKMSKKEKKSRRVEKSSSSGRRYEN